MGGEGLSHKANDCPGCELTWGRRSFKHSFSMYKSQARESVALGRVRSKDSVFGLGRVNEDSRVQKGPGDP